jgi:hypothetical protein
MWFMREVHTTRSTDFGVLPMAIFVPLPQGTMVKLPRQAHFTMLATILVSFGKTTALGTTPSTV